ncbi:MAG: RbsD/FucU family protein [Planctomycetales bacterium]|nr:RbsD/FucU family protein [Planctomycetales bacterium]
MLFGKLIHPQISAILARAGHSSKVLIADGNYPASSTLGPNAELVSLNLRPGLVTVSQVLETLAKAVPIEAIHTMGMPADDPFRLDHDPPVWDEYRSVLTKIGLAIQLEPIQRWDFYDAVASRDHVLTIQTGDQALWANLLLTIGVRTAPS